MSIDGKKERIREKWKVRLDGMKKEKKDNIQRKVYKKKLAVS